MTKISEWEIDGFRAVIMKHDEMQHLCGYAGIPQGHPLHSKQCDDIEVHNSISYESDISPTGERDGLWWIGFHCAGLFDETPGEQGAPFPPIVPREYRDEEFVKKELFKMVAQIKALGE